MPPEVADYELLGQLIAADDAAGGVNTFSLFEPGGSGFVVAGHAGWTEESLAPTESQVDELEDLGWVRVLKRDGSSRQFVVTKEGRRAWSLSIAEPAVGKRVRLDWGSSRALLVRIHDMYLAAGAPQFGVDISPMLSEGLERGTVLAQLRELGRAGWLDVHFENAAGPRDVSPSTRTLQLLEQWPAEPAQDVLAELVAALDAEIDQTHDDGKRSKLLQLRDGLMGVGRDFALAWLEKKTGV